MLKRKGIPECTLFVLQRLTKYPILIEDQLKLIKDKIKEDKVKKHKRTEDKITEDEIEHGKLLTANDLIKKILVHVDNRVAEKEKDERHLDIYKRIDAKSSTLYKNNEFKKSHIIDSDRKLM